MDSKQPDGQKQQAPLILVIYTTDFDERVLRFHSRGIEFGSVPDALHFEATTSAKPLCMPNAKTP